MTGGIPRPVRLWRRVLVSAVGILLLLLGAAVAATIPYMQRLEAVAQVAAPIHSRVRLGEVVDYLVPGEVLPVRGCRDMKHWLLIETPPGFVHSGDVVLRGHDLLDWGRGALSVSCPPVARRPPGAPA
ncbi:MAG: hypothetical protein JNK67_11850 [Alphaproteobacteria bacterium]|nr:hypothetical protein [Alphaproteobacteria bacterium]